MVNSIVKLEWLLLGLLECKLLVIKYDLETRNSAFYIHQDPSLESVTILYRTTSSVFYLFVSELLR